MKRTTLDDQTGRTEYVDVAGGRIACEVVGHGPLVVLSPGVADTRSSYRFLAPLIAGRLVLFYNAISPGLGPRVAVVLSLVEFALGTALLWLLPATRAAQTPGGTEAVA